MNETTKALRLESRREIYDCFIPEDTRGIDIGCGNDPLQLPGRIVTQFDKEHGDAQELCSLPYGTAPYDFVYASHVLEHMVNVPEAFANWMKLLKPLGYMVIVVPEFRLYERCQWPSPFNSDHKASFTLFDNLPKKHCFTYGFGNMCQMGISNGASVVHVGLETDGYDFSLLQSRFLIDQTAADACANIVYVFRKK